MPVKTLWTAPDTVIGLVECARFAPSVSTGTTDDMALCAIVAPQEPAMTQLPPGAHKHLVTPAATQHARCAVMFFVDYMLCVDVFVAQTALHHGGFKKVCRCLHAYL